MTKHFTHYVPKGQDSATFHLVDHPDTCECLPKCVLESFEVLPNGKRQEEWSVHHKRFTSAPRHNQWHKKGFAE